MVGYQAVDFAVKQFFPHPFLVFLVANWRRTFCQGANLFELIGIEDKIVRARFTGDILAFLTRARYFLYPLRAADGKRADGNLPLSPDTARDEWLPLQ